MLTIERCGFCGFDAVSLTSTDTHTSCPNCGTARGGKPAEPAKFEPGHNIWGDLLVILSLAVLAYLLHGMLWREF